MNSSSKKDGLYVIKSLSDSKIYNDNIYNSLGEVIYIPKENEEYNIVHSRGNDYIFEIRDLEDNSISYRHFKYNENNKNLDLLRTIYNEKLSTVFIEENDSFIVFEEKRSKGLKKELYSLNKSSFITPKVDNIEKIDRDDKSYFLFEDIDYKPNIDRENHIYGILDNNGKYKGYIYDYYFNRKYLCDIYEQPFFMKYYTLRMQIDRRFKDALLNELLEDEETKQLKR